MQLTSYCLGFTLLLWVYTCRSHDTLYVSHMTLYVSHMTHCLLLVQGDAEATGSPPPSLCCLFCREPCLAGGDGGRVEGEGARESTPPPTPRMAGRPPLQRGPPAVTRIKVVLAEWKCSLRQPSYLYDKDTATRVHFPIFKLVHSCKTCIYLTF